nr:Gag-Pol polyprotein [Tanacetum cinerariifolium]
MTLNEQILDLNKQLSKEKSTVSSLLEEKKRLKSDFKTRKDELLDKQIQLEKRIKELNNILVKTGQSIQTIHMLSPKPDSFYHTEQKIALGYQNPFYLKQAQKKQQSLYDGKVLHEKHDPPVVHDLEETLKLAQESHQKMKQLNKEIKPTNYTKINHLSGEASKFVGDFKSLANEADASLVKHKALELEIKRLLKAVVSHDIMNIVQKESVVDTSDLQTELERTKERFENCIIKKENEYVKLWNDWYKKCDECKYDKILYDKAYKDMQQKIERLLLDQEGKLIAFSESESQSDCSNGDNACTSNAIEPKIKRFPNFTSLLDRTKRIMETMNLSFDELSGMAFEQRSLKPGLQTTARPVPPAQETQVHQTSTTSTTIADTAPTPTNSSSHATNILITSQDVDELNLNTMVDGNTFCQSTKDHPLEQVIGEPSRPVLTRNQLRSYGDMCMYALTVSTMKPKNVKEAMIDPAWIDSMQEELFQFKRLDVWVLVPAPDNISPLTLKWLFKNKHDEEQTVIRKSLVWS